MKMNKRKKTKILLSSLFMVTGAIALSTPLLAQNNVFINKDISIDTKANNNQQIEVDTSPGWHALPKYGPNTIDQSKLRQSNGSLRKSGKFSVTDFDIEFDTMKVTDFLPLQSNDAFKSLINDYWRVLFSWSKNEWADMITDFQVQYSVSEDQRSVEINVQWRNNTPQYWWCTFSVSGFLSPDGPLNPEGIPSYVWYIVGGVAGFIVLIALIVLIAMIIKKQDKIDRSLKKMSARRTTPPKMLCHKVGPAQNNQLPPSGQNKQKPTNTRGQANGFGMPGMPNNRNPFSSRPPFPDARSGIGAQKPGMNKPAPPPPIEVAGPPRSLAPKRK